MSAFMISIEMGVIDVFKLLMPYSQTDVNIISTKDESAIEIATKMGSLKLVKLLMRCPKTNITKLLQKNNELHGPNIEEVLKYVTKLRNLPSTCCLGVEESLLHAAWTDNFRAIGGLLLCPDANINIVDPKGRTPLYLASWLGHTKTINELLKFNNTGIDVNKGRIIDGSSPFAVASEKGHLNVMKKLIHLDNISVSKGWDNDSWTQYITRFKAMTKPTTAQAEIATTTQRGQYFKTFITEEFLVLKSI